MATYEPLGSVTLASDATSIEVTNIPQTYRDLRIVTYLQNSAVGGQNTDMYFTWSGLSDANFRQTELYTEGASAVSRRYVGRSNVWSENSVTRDWPSFALIDILDYTNTNFYTTALIWVAKDNTTIAANILRFIVGTYYNGTYAVDRFKVANGSGNFAAGSRLTIYGIE